MGDNCSMISTMTNDEPDPPRRAKEDAPASRPKVSNVFISCSKADFSLAEEVARELSDRNFECTFKRASRRGVLRTLDHCDAMLLIWSEHAVDSKWVERELSYVMLEPEYKNRLVPVILNTERNRKLKAPWAIKLMNCLYIDPQTERDDKVEKIALHFTKALEE